MGLAKIVLNNNTEINIECSGYCFENEFICFTKGTEDPKEENFHRVALIQKSEVKYVLLERKDEEQRTISMNIEADVNAEDIANTFNKFSQTGNSQTNVLSTKQAMEFICGELAKDKSNGSWYYSWQSNIAMAFFDVLPDFTDKHELCNVAAKRFLDNLTS